MAKARKWLKYTPWKRGIAYVYGRNSRFDNISENEMLFALLVWVGMPRAYAYSLAFPDSKADAVSVPQLASRLMQSWGMRSFFKELAEKEKSMAFRYPKDIEDAKHPYGC